MKSNKAILGLIALWGLYLFYLILVDVSAFWVSIVLTPPFGLAAYLAFRSKNLILQLFALFSFVAHAIGAPYFWIVRANYSYSGSGAVKDFDFSLAQLFAIYVWVVCLTMLIVIFTRLFDGIRFRHRFVLSHRLAQRCRESQANKTVAATHAMRAKYGNLSILLLIVLIAVPLNIYMALNQIGTLGILSKPLPFRLLGIMYYSRLILIPLALTWLYFRSSRGWWIFFLIASYSIFAGLSSASRTVPLLTLMPLIIDVIIGKQKVKGVILGLVAGVTILFVSSSRDYTYSAQGFSYSDMISDTFYFLLSSNDITPASIVGGIANRLFGAQDMILAYQYAPPTPYFSFIRYFLTGGRADAVVPDLGYDFYGIVYDEDSGFGVGIGTLAYLLTLGRASLPLVPLGAIVIALLLSFGNRCLTWVSSYDRYNLAASVRLFVAVLLAFSIYSSSLNYYYLYLELVILFGLTMQFLTVFRITLWPTKKPCMIVNPDSAQ